MLEDVLCSYCLRGRSVTGPMAFSPLAAICRDCARGALEKMEQATEHPRRDPDAPFSFWSHLSDDELLGRLPQVAAAGTQVEEHLQSWVGAARERGMSWARIGAALGMTRQSAWERFTPRDDR
ncbi:hypothetical protein DWB68_08505 [Galactobacter valiniphilus]|uniref:ClpX-type ZB domain-containing protein n=1 Tax=Galactobacter valiniphilus TaxID=2676122 RepID=A0A399J9Q1_9MICC|nr:hypothetical protein [Galactobacter valiniphilus]RII42258.1 hypothetical protein DWB68_08505 [Galactobacter valiniphilus]